MTNEISTFFWTANKDNCIAILNYELNAIVTDNSWHNDACPSATITMEDGRVFSIFMPSTYYDQDGMCDIFSLFDSEDEFIFSTPNIKSIINYLNK
jgi:hypothetical protein